MSVAKILELSARSDQSFDAAIADGIAKASDSVHGIREAWIQDMKVQVEEGRVVGYQVDMRITFVVD
jgi:dodecin